MANKVVEYIVRAKDETNAGFKAAREHVKEFANQARELLFEAFAFENIKEKVAEFFKGAVEKATEAERAWTQLSNTLANIGVDAAKAKPALEEHIKLLQKITNVNDADAIAGFDKLVSITGNYQKSLANLNLVADVAARKQIGFVEAAQLVGKVMAGSGGKALKEFGITTKDAALATEELRAKVKGAAETELQTFEGRLKGVKTAYTQMQEEAGKIITQSPTFRNMLLSITGKLQDLTTWIGDNRQRITEWAVSFSASFKAVGISLVDLVGVFYNGFRAILKFGSFQFDAGMEYARRTRAAVGDIGEAWTNAVKEVEHAEAGKAVALGRTKKELEDNAAAMRQLKEEEGSAARSAAQKKLEEQLDKRIDLLKRAGELTQFHADALESLRFIEHGITAALKDGNLTMEKRVDLESRLAKVREARKALKDPQLERSALERSVDASLGGLRSAGEVSHRAVQDTADAITTDIRNNRDKYKPAALKGEGLPDLGFATDLSTKLDAASKAMDPLNEKALTFSGVMADIVSGPITQFGDSIAAAMEAFASGSERAGEAFKKSMLSALRSVAMAEGKQFEARALAALAKAIGGDVAGLAEFGQWQAAAVAMFAAAGLAGGMASGSGGSGARGAPSSSTAYVGDRGEFSKSKKATIVWNGSSWLDMSDPRQRDFLVEALNTLAEYREIEIITARNS